MSPTRSQWLIRTTVLLLLVTVLAIGVIASGVFDPAPAGTLLWRRDDKRLPVSSEARDIIWLDKKATDLPSTIRVTAAQKSGDEDMGYGLVLGDEEAYLAIAVSPVGYLAIWQTDVQFSDGADSFILEWQIWPHVKTEGSSNEIWVDVSGNRASVRINREWLWEGEVALGSGNIGLLAESFAEPAVVDFQTVELFAKSNR